MFGSLLLSCWLAVSLFALHSAANSNLEQSVSTESPPSDALPLPDDLVESEIVSKLPLGARINFCLMNRKIWSNTSSYRLFDRVFGNCHYEADYLDKFQSVLSILEVRQDLCRLVTAEDIVRAYDRLMRSADPNPSQIIDPKPSTLIRSADILEQQRLVRAQITDNMDNLIKILNNEDLEILVQGLYLSDALLIDNVSKMPHLIRKRIRLLTKSGRYAPNLSTYLIQFGKLTRDPAGEEKILAFLNGSVREYRAVVLALLECGLRFNLFSVFCPRLAKAFPFFRGAFLEGPEQGRCLHRYFISWYSTPLCIMNRHHPYIPAVFSHICRHISEFLINGSFLDMTFIGLTILRQKGPVLARKVFNTVGSDGSTLLHRLFDREWRGPEAGRNFPVDRHRVTSEEMKQLLTVPGLHINAQDQTGLTVLHLAVMTESSIDVVSEILSYPGIDPRLRNKKGKTPRCLAEKLRLEDHLRLLPEKQSFQRKIFGIRLPF